MRTAGYHMAAPLREVKARGRAAPKGGDHETLVAFLWVAGAPTAFLWVAGAPTPAPRLSVGRRGPDPGSATYLGGAVGSAVGIAVGICNVDGMGMAVGIWIAVGMAMALGIAGSVEGIPGKAGIAGRTATGCALPDAAGTGFTAAGVAA